MRPHYTLRKALVHPKEKVKKENTYGVVYEILCHNCALKYIGETGRKFNTRLREHQKDDKNVPQVYIWSERKFSDTCINKSAVTYHITKAKYVIGWEGANVVDRKNNRRLRQVKSVCMRHEREPGDTQPE